MSNKNLETIFQFAAIGLVGVAAFFLWKEDFETVFIISVVAFVSYFLSFRFQVKERLDKREAERIEQENNELDFNRNILQESRSLFDIEETDFDKQTEKVLKEK